MVRDSLYGEVTKEDLKVVEKAGGKAFQVKEGKGLSLEVQKQGMLVELSA